MKDIVYAMQFLLCAVAGKFIYFDVIKPILVSIGWF